MTRMDMTPEEIRALPRKSVMYDGDDFKMVKLDGGWMYANLIKEDGESTDRTLLPEPRAYPPYSTLPKDLKRAASHA